MVLRLVFLLLAVSWVAQSQMSTDGDEPEPSIIGGRDAPDGYRPFQVSIRQVDVVRDTKFHICSGTILSNLYVITAAHCLYRRTVSRLLCIAGGNDLNGAGAWHYVDSVKIHEDYKDGFDYDLALMKMKVPFEFGKSIAAIKYARYNTPSNQNCEVSGWGYRRGANHLEQSSKLQVVNVTTTTFSDCYYSYQLFEGYEITTKHICTYKKDKGICYGDGGDPLTLNNELIGVASYVVPCAKRYPDVFVNIVQFRNWIEKNMK